MSGDEEARRRERAGDNVGGVELSGGLGGIATVLRHDLAEQIRGMVKSNFELGPEGLVQFFFALR